MRHALLPLLGLSLMFAIGCRRGEPVQEISAASLHSEGELNPVEVAEGDWPWWRGTHRDGIATAAAPPVVFGGAPGDEQNLVWQTPLATSGHASPVVWQDKVFLAAADEEAETLSLVCFERAAGRQLWQRELHRGNFIKKHNKNSHASATPACDGQRVLAVFAVQDALWLSAVALDGELLWQTRLGGFRSQHGFGASPVIFGPLVIVSGDNNGPGYLVAVDRQSGEIVWRKARTNQPSYGSPVVAHVAGYDQLILSGAGMVTSYNPTTGERLWFCNGPAQVIGNTVATDEQHVYASGGYPEKELLCIRADGSGDVTDTHVVWSTEENVSYVPSPLVHQGRLYTISDNGIATCYEAHTGKVLWRERLGGNFSASPLLAGGNIYAADERGKVYVLRASDQYGLLATNELGSGQLATMVPSGNQLFARTVDALYCIGAEEAPAESTARVSR